MMGLRATLLAQLLLLLALAASTGQGESHSQPPEPPPPAMDSNVSPLELLEMGAPAVRYLRAFTTLCWQPDQSAPIAMFDNSWAVALVTIWNDLTVPSNGLGRLVTAAQLQAEGSLMIEDGRPGDALSVLELAVLFTLYPVHHDSGALAAWHQSLASNETAFASRRMALAGTLVLMARAQAAVGAASSNVDALEAAVTAGRAAAQLMAMGDPSKDSQEATAQQPQQQQPQQQQGDADQEQEQEANTPEGLQRLMAEAVRHTVAVLRDARLAELERLLDRRGLKCRWSCGKRSSMLKLLVPALRVPLRLAAVDGEEGASVDAPADLLDQLAPACRAGGGGACSSGQVARLGALFAQVVATLQQPLLADIGIKCSAPAGQQLLHRCRDAAERQFGAWAGGQAASTQPMQNLLAHVTQVQEALWRLDEVLEAAMTGVRLGDGTTWVKHRGYAWVLGSHMASKLYPQGQGAPAYYQTRRPVEPHAGSTICLDKTYLLDTVLRLDQEGLRGLQYALDNLQYAQFHAGGAEPFWRLLSKDNPLCSGAACQTGQDPVLQLLAGEVGAPVPRAPRPLSVDFRFVSEQQLQADLAAATDPSYRPRDPFVAAFVSLCVVSCASIYLYSNRGWLARALTPTRSRTAAAVAAATGGAPTVVQRNAATSALREALSGDSANRLHAAIDSAEAAGVEKPLVKKAKNALQALKKRRQQGGSIPPSAAAAALHRSQSTSGRSTAPLRAAASRLGVPTGSSGSLGRSLSEHTAALYAAAAAAASEAWLGDGSEAGGTETDGYEGSESAMPGGRLHSRSRGSSSRSGSPTPTDTSSGSSSAGAQAAAAHAASLASPKPPGRRRMVPHSSSEPEPPTSPGTPVESVVRSSPGDASGGHTSSDTCSPLASPLTDGGGAAAAAALQAAAAAAPQPTPTPSSTAASTPKASSSRDRSGSGTPTSAAAADGGLGAAPRQQLTPRQAKKLLRLQQKHAQRLGLGSPPEELAAVLAGPPLAHLSCHPAAAAAAAAAVGLALPGSPGRSDSALAEKAQEACGPLQEESKEESGEAQVRELTERELVALAAREESAPSKVPRSAKKKAKREAERAANPASGAGGGAASSTSGSDAPERRDERYGGGGGGRYGARYEMSYGPGQPGGQPGAYYSSGGVRRTLSDPQGQGYGPLSPLRHAGTGRMDELAAMHDPRLHSVAAGWPAHSYWQGQGGQNGMLNANAPEFSPSPSRPHSDARMRSPGGYAPTHLPSGMALPPGRFLDPHQAAMGLGGGPGGHASHSGGLRYSPDSSLGYLAASLAQQQAGLGPQGGDGSAPLQQASLLAQLQQIWGEGAEGGGGGAAGGRVGVPSGPGGGTLPGFGAGMGSSAAAAAMLASTQQQQQLAALLFMQQQLEQQAAAARGGGGSPGGQSGADSAPLSPQQLPPASASMLREVLGSPLSPLQHGGWPGSSVSTAPALGSAPADSLEGAEPSLSLGAEMAAAAAMALRALGELPEEGASRAALGLSPRASTAPNTARPGAVRSLSEAVHTAAQRGSLDRLSPAGGGGGGSYGPAASGPPAHRIDSMDLEALGFTESGDAE